MVVAVAPVAIVAWVQSLAWELSQGVGEAPSLLYTSLRRQTRFLQYPVCGTRQPHEVWEGPV